MNTEEWFIDGNNLPNSLPKSEFECLLRKAREGDRGALEELVLHRSEEHTSELQSQR